MHDKRNIKQDAVAVSHAKILLDRFQIREIIAKSLANLAHCTANIN